MQEHIELKSNKYVLTLVMDPVVPFADILHDVREKFTRSERFFKGAQMALEFSGRVLEEEEQRQVLLAIRQSCGLEILCVIEQDPDKEALQYQAIVTALEQQPKVQEEAAESARVLTGTMHNGQSYSCEQSILLLGDLEPGAQLNAGGSIVVCGIAMGTLRAGLGGNENACVSALVLKPALLEIAGHRSVSGIRKRELDESYQVAPQVAVIEEGRMKIEAVSGRAWSHLLERKGENRQV